MWRTDLKLSNLASISPKSFTFFVFLSVLLSVLIVGNSNADRILSTIDIPENSSGLAFDGRLLWIGGIGPMGNWIRALDPATGEINDSLPAPVPDCIGLTWFRNGLAYLSPRSDTTYLVTPEGSIPLFCNPYSNLGGLGSDGESLWSSTYSSPSGTVIRMDGDGQVILSMPYTGRHSRDLAFHNDRLIIPDRLAQEIRLVNPVTGRFIRTFPSPGFNPDGLTSDGEYLWLMDDGDQKNGDRLYHVQLSPDGFIRFSSLSHNYGSVVINEEENWILWIYNDAARPARLVSFDIENGNDDIFVPHLWAFPESIAAGDSVGLTITFQPAYQDSVQIDFGLTFDLDRETYWVNCRGKGVRPRRDILISQRQLDFGTARFGDYLRSSNLRFLLIENNGGEPLTIRDLQFSDESFFYGFYDFPHTFDEPGLYPIPIFFQPNRTLGFNESLTILSDDPDSPQIQINLTGTGNLDIYSGGRVLWRTTVGDGDLAVPLVRAIQDIDDVTGDGLADVVIASNDYLIRAYHAASTDLAIPIWTYRTDANPWRSGTVPGQRSMSEGSDWDDDGVKDIVFGLMGGSKQVIALSGRTSEEIWIFDTHGMHGGGGNVVVARGELDFNEDDVNDVYAATAAADEQHRTNSVFLLNGGNGQAIWLYEAPAPVLDVYAVEDITGDENSDLIALCENGTVIAIDGHRGRVAWEAEVEGDIRAMFVIGDVNEDGSEDVGFIAFHNGITVINGSNGIQLWNSRAHDMLTVGIPLNDLNDNGSPDIAYGDDNNHIRAIDGRTAVAAWDTSVYVGSPALSMAPLQDFDNDGRIEYVVGTQIGRVFALLGDGYGGLWSYSAVGEGNAFVLVVGSRDIDGNGEMDVFGAMENGNVYCFAGSYVGNASVDPDHKTQVPITLIVDPAYPNPFNSTVNIPIRLTKSGVLDMRIVDILGREVFRSRTASMQAGSHRLVWEGNASSGLSLPSGFYLIELQSASQRIVRPVELIR